MKEWIWLDMDGTIADLYGVDGWLNDLINHSTRPYEIAKPMYDLYDLIGTLNDLREVGYKIGIISWSSKEQNPIFDKRVRQAKKDWLLLNCLDKVVDTMIVTAYGVCKADTCKLYGKGILVDDEEPNRNAWYLGDTINANENILEILKNMLDK